MEKGDWRTQTFGLDNSLIICPFLYRVACLLDLALSHFCPSFLVGVKCHTYGSL